MIGKVCISRWAYATVYTLTLGSRSRSKSNILIQQNQHYIAWLENESLVMVNFPEKQTNVILRFPDDCYACGSSTYEEKLCQFANNKRHM